MLGATAKQHVFIRVNRAFFSAFASYTFIRGKCAFCNPSRLFPLPATPAPQIEEPLKESSQVSMGTDISEEDIRHISELAEQVRRDVLLAIQPQWTSAGGAGACLVWYSLSSPGIQPRYAGGAGAVLLIVVILYEIIQPPWSRRSAPLRIRTSQTRASSVPPLAPLPLPIKRHTCYILPDNRLTSLLSHISLCRWCP